VEGDPFVGVVPYKYWSATENTPGNAWTANLFLGFVDFATKGINNVTVWPVRGGQ
jgi:hypothetical protein